MTQKIEQIVWMNPDDLVPYEMNAKLHPASQVEHIANSIKAFGWTQPIVVDENNVVVIGHGRLMAAKELHLDRVPVVCRDDLTEEQINACRLADNKTNESGWDFSKLEEELAQLAIDGIDMEQFGFDDIGIDENAMPVNSVKTDEKYFSDKEIEQEIIDGWKTYDDVKEFASLAIDRANAMHQFNRLCQGYEEGYNISLLFNPHRLNTETRKSKSIFYGFNNDKGYRKEFARYIVQLSNRVPPMNEYYKMISAGHNGYQYVNEFRPYMARDIYKKYVKNGDKVLNPCAGWGGRLIGIASCLFSDIEYVETDPQTETYNGLVKLKEFLRLGDNYKQYNLPFEDLEVEKEYFDFVFTSPPYFDTEKYSDENTQSYKKYDSFDRWKNGFLKPMIDKILYCMKADGKCLLNVGNAIYQIDTAIDDYLDEKGINHKRVSDFKIGGDGIGARTGEDGEPFILFWK